MKKYEFNLNNLSIYMEDDGKDRYGSIDGNIYASEYVYGKDEEEVLEELIKKSEALRTNLLSAETQMKSLLARVKLVKQGEFMGHYTIPAKDFDRIVKELESNEGPSEQVLKAREQYEKIQNLKNISNTLERCNGAMKNKPSACGCGDCG